MWNWLKSNKQAILNILMLIIVVLQSAQGQAWIDPKLQAMIITILNAVIGFLNQPVARMQARRQAKLAAKLNR